MLLKRHLMGKVKRGSEHSPPECQVAQKLFSHTVKMKKTLSFWITITYVRKLFIKHKTKLFLMLTTNFRTSTTFFVLMIKQKKCSLMSPAYNKS
jgi:hypothetical protein